MSENVPAVMNEQQLALLMDAAPTNDFVRDDLMIPSLRILQSNSKETKRSQPEYVDGATDGLFFINVTRQLFESVRVIPVKYMHVVREFASADLNARMVADHGTDLSVLNGLERDDRGRYLRPDSAHVLTDSALYYLLVLTPDGAVPCAMRLGSTQWRKARRWNTVMQHFEMKDNNGRLFRPPMYARSYMLTARPEQNDDNSWFGYHIEPDALTLALPDGMDMFMRAKAFREAADSGKTTVVEDAPVGNAARDPADEGEQPGDPGHTNGQGGTRPGRAAPLDDEIPF